MPATLAASRTFALADEFFTILGEGARDDVTAFVRDGRILAHVSGPGMLSGQLAEAIKAAGMHIEMCYAINPPVFQVTKRPPRRR